MTTKKKTTKTKSKKKVQAERIVRSGGELEFEGFERQLYSWIKQRRMFCALHKVLYYKFDEPMLHDKQYDYVEYMLNAVEQKHKNIADAVSAEGYMSPNNYVDALDDDVLYARAEMVLNKWKSSGGKPLAIPMVTASDTDDILYTKALESIRLHPI